MKEVVAQLVGLVGQVHSRVASAGIETNRRSTRLNMGIESHSGETAGSKPCNFGKSDEMFHDIAGVIQKHPRP